jgi:hypothetical protein
MYPKAGTTFRFFSERVFGVPVDGTIRHFNKKKRTITINAYCQGQRWIARRSIDNNTFFNNNGDTFKFTALTVNQEFVLKYMLDNNIGAINHEGFFRFPQQFRDSPTLADQVTEIIRANQAAKV